MSSIAFLTLAISLGAVLGISLGQIRYRGVGLGIGGVLFAGILVGHLAHQYCGLDIHDESGVLTPAGHILHYVQEFGLILFVYVIGIQVGPSFFSSLRGQGAKLIGLAVLIILGGCGIALALYFAGIVPLDAMIGMYSGAITNTPALGAGTAMIQELAAAFARDTGTVPEGLNPSVVPSAYAMAYPFAVCSLLIVIVMIRIVFRVDIDTAGEEYALAKSGGKPALTSVNIVLKDSNYIGKTIGDIPGVERGVVVCSRLKRGDKLHAPDHHVVLMEGDMLHMVGMPEHLKEAMVIGEPTRDVLTTHGSGLQVRHVILTKNAVLNRTLGELSLDERCGVVVSRVFRSGFQFMPDPHLKLRFGDELNVVGSEENLHKVAEVVGDSKAAINKVAMLPMFIGIGLGILLGSIPIAIPGVPAPLKLGIAGGPLIMAIFLARFGDAWSFNVLHWRMPVAALAAFREIGISLFLTIVGISAGASGFWETLTEGPGLMWMGWATLISFIPLCVVGLLAYKFAKINYLVLSGMLAGSYTDPPALAYANGMYKDPEASAIGYATVYPFVMFLRILSPQIMIIIAAAAL